MFGTGYRRSDEMNHATWLEHAVIELKLCLWPRRCDVSNKVLWLRFAYRTRRYFRSGDIDFITEDRWYNKDEFLILKLKGC